MSDYIALVFLLNLWSLEFSFSTLQINVLCISLNRETHSSGVYTVVLRFLTFFPVQSPYTTEACSGRSEVTNVNYLRPFWVITGHYCAMEARSLLLAPALVEVRVSYLRVGFHMWLIHTYIHTYVRTYVGSLHTDRHAHKNKQNNTQHSIIHYVSVDGVRVQGQKFNLLRHITIRFSSVRFINVLAGWLAV